MLIEKENLKIALVHDWLLALGGAEKVLKSLHEMFPTAPIYTLFHNEKFTDKFLPGADIRPSFLQKIYKLFGHKLLTPILPIGIESFDLSEYDLVISSAVAFSKGLVLKPRTRHVCYCYSPMRQVWDWQLEYRKESRVPRFFTAVLQHLLRIWDRSASERVDHFLAISENVQQRILKYYRRDSEIIYPPADLLTGVHEIDKGFFLIVSRLFKHKNVETAVEAFNKLEWPLVIIGCGPELKRLRKIAGPTVKLLGYRPDDVTRVYFASCSAFIMPQEEDFGLTPIEAMSCGKPVLALKRGGALEYIREGVNGEFFEDPVEQSLADGARRLKENIPRYNKEEIRESAQRFSTGRFKKEFLAFIEKIYSNDDRTNNAEKRNSNNPGDLYNRPAI